MGKSLDQKYELESKPTKKPLGTIRFVAPDGETGDPACHDFFNTLVLPREYKLQVRLGKFDDLYPTAVADETDAFPSKTNTTKTLSGTNFVDTTVNGTGKFTGRKMRLQALGLFNRPVDHIDSSKCYDVVWKHYKEKLHTPVLVDAITPPQVNSPADQKLLDELQEEILKGGKLPEADKFAKIRLPGTYAFFSRLNNAIYEPNFDGRYGLSSDRFVAEKTYYDANTVLGMIPIEAHVSQRDLSGKWTDAPGVKVYFQLVPPTDPLPAEMAAIGLRESTMGTGTVAAPQFATGKGQKAYIKKRREHSTDNTDPENKWANPTGDPQGLNAHKDMGGKRGEAHVGGSIFQVKSIPGFNEKHALRPDMDHKPYLVPEAVTPEGEKFKHCVRATTNAEGDCGVIFTPSRVGGDRYKIRVFIGPPTLENDGKGEDAIFVETGTMVVWRTIRLSRFVRHKVAVGSISATFKAEAAAYFGATPAQINTWLGNQASLKDLGDIDFSALGNVNAPYEGPARQYGKAWNEFIVEPQVSLPEELPAIEPEWRAALEAAIVKAEQIQTAHPGEFKYDLRKLIYFDAASPFTFNIHTPAAYNASAPGITKTMATVSGNTEQSTTVERTTVSALVRNVLFPEFMHALNQNGFLPGLTVIYGAYGCNWQLLGELPPGGSISTSGVAQRSNGCYVWYSKTTYDTWGIYNLDSNTCHEMGHCLYREHAPGGGSGGAKADFHDVAPEVCVMSYSNCEGQYCGQCIGALMGYDTRQAAFKNA